MERVQIKVDKGQERGFFIVGSNGFLLRRELGLDEKDRDSFYYELDFGSVRPTSNFLIQLLKDSYKSRCFYAKYKIKGEPHIVKKIKLVFRMMSNLNEEGAL